MATQNQPQRLEPLFVYKGQARRARLEQGYTISGGVDEDHPATKARLAAAEDAREQHEALQIAKQKQQQAFMFKSAFKETLIAGLSAEGLNKALEENEYVKESLANAGIASFESVNIRDQNQYNQIAQTFGEENAKAALQAPQRTINGQFIGVRDENGQLKIWSTETLGAVIGETKEKMDGIFNMHMMQDPAIYKAYIGNEAKLKQQLLKNQGQETVQRLKGEQAQTLERMKIDFKLDLTDKQFEQTMAIVNQNHENALELAEIAHKYGLDEAEFMSNLRREEENIKFAQTLERDKQEQAFQLIKARMEIEAENKNVQAKLDSNEKIAELSEVGRNIRAAQQYQAQTRVAEIGAESRETVATINAESREKVQDSINSTTLTVEDKRAAVKTAIAELELSDSEADRKLAKELAELANKKDLDIAKINERIAAANRESKEKLQASQQEFLIEKLGLEQDHAKEILRIQHKDKITFAEHQKAYDLAILYAEQSGEMEKAKYLAEQKFKMSALDWENENARDAAERQLKRDINQSMLDDKAKDRAHESVLKDKSLASALEIAMVKDSTSRYNATVQAQSDQKIAQMKIDASMEKYRSDNQTEAQKTDKIIMKELGTNDITQVASLYAAATPSTQAAIRNVAINQIKNIDNKLAEYLEDVSGVSFLATLTANGLDNIDRIAGQIDTYVRKLENFIPGATDYSDAVTTIAISQAYAKIRHELYGAAVTDRELGMFLEAYGSVKDQPAKLRAALTTYYGKKLTELKTRRDLAPSAAIGEIYFGRTIQQLESALKLLHDASPKGQQEAFLNKGTGQGTPQGTPQDKQGTQGEPPVLDKKAEKEFDSVGG